MYDQEILERLVNIGATCDTGKKSLLLNQHFFDNRVIFALRAVIDKCKSDGNDEMMAQFIFSGFLSRALFSINFNGNGPQ